MERSEQQEKPLDPLEAIIRAEADASIEEGGFSYLYYFRSLRLGNYQLRTIFNCACDFSGGIHIYPATSIAKGDVLKIRYRNKVLTDFDFVEFVPEPDEKE